MVMQFAGMMMMGAANDLISPFMRPYKQLAESVARSQILSPAEAVNARRTGAYDEGQFLATMRQGGFVDDRSLALLRASTGGIPEAILIDAKRRGIIPESNFQDRMARFGWSATDALILEQAQAYYPSAQDLITWAAKEVYEQDSVRKYGLADELDKLDQAPFRKRGIDAEQVRNYWVAHWEHPSWTQVQRFLHYGQVDGSFSVEDAKEWFRLVEIPPYWRDFFTSTAFQPYTRVDIRRMWDLGVVSDQQVIEAYQREGYDLEHAKNLLIFSKVERQLPELQKRYRNGWITREELMAELKTFGIKPERVQGIYERTIKADSAERVAKDRELTKAEIIKGVKKEAITREVGQLMLQRLGYDADEANFLLTINVTALTGSPETPLEHWQLIEEYRKAEGQENLAIPLPLLAAEKEWLSQRAELQKRLSGDAAPGALELLTESVQNAEYRYRMMLAVEGWLPE